MGHITFRIDILDDDLLLWLTNTIRHQLQLHMALNVNTQTLRYIYKAINFINILH